MVEMMELNIMKQLWNQPAPVPHGELVKAVDASPSTVSRWLKKMEYKGMIRRESAGYVPVLTAKQLGANEIKEMVDLLYDGNPTELLMDYLAGAGPEGRVNLKKALDQMDKAF